MRFATFEEAVAAHATGTQLLAYAVTQLSDFNDGSNVVLDFLDRRAVGVFCAAIGIKRNWAALPIDEIAPPDSTGTNVCDQPEADIVLALLKEMIAKKYLTPTNKGQSQSDLLNDFLPAGTRFQRKKCSGHSLEFAYALAVELEHGRQRGMNVTNNHPLLTGLVVMSHLAEDRLYYGRLWVMETEGELFDLQTKHAPYAEVEQVLHRLAVAQSYLARRMEEALANL